MNVGLEKKWRGLELIFPIVIQGTFVLEVPGLEDEVSRHCSCFPYDKESVVYLSSASEARAQTSRMCFDYSCCTAEAGKESTEVSFLLYLSTSAHLWKL